MPFGRLALYGTAICTLLVGGMIVSPAPEQVQAQACAPRPAVRVLTEITSPETAQVTVHAGLGTFRSITFGAPHNTVFLATGDIQPAANETLTLSSSPVRFTFRPANPSAAVTIPFTITDDCGPWNTFVGAGSGAWSPATSSTVVAVGDIACSSADGSFNGGAGLPAACRQRATSDLALSLSPDAVLLLGDLQYDTGQLPQYQAVFDPTWGRLKSKIRPAPGNHDYYTPNASGYFTYFGATAGDHARGYYATELPGWRLLALNSNCAEVGGCHAGSPQEQWLRAELAAHPSPCTLAYWHHPRWSSGLHGNDTAYDAFWRALYDAQVDLVLNGHDHSYERLGRQTPDGVSDPRGIREFVVGTGGRSRYAFGTPLPLSRFRSNEFGVLRLELSRDAYSWQFIGIDGQGVLDQGSQGCHKAATTAAQVGSAAVTATIASLPQLTSPLPGEIKAKKAKKAKKARKGSQR